MEPVAKVTYGEKLPYWDFKEREFIHEKPMN
jgi:hypothetical protein